MGREPVWWSCGVNKRRCYLARTRRQLRSPKEHDLACFDVPEASNAPIRAAARPQIAWFDADQLARSLVSLGEPRVVDLRRNRSGRRNSQHKPEMGACVDKGTAEGALSESE